MMMFLKKINRVLNVSMTWMLSCRLQAAKRKSGTVHVLFCMCDHYEPGTGNVSINEGTRRVDELIEKYPSLADRHYDSNGFKPKRSWFFPPHYHKNGWLKKLVSLCERGYGEIEMHLHHGKQVPDTSENLRATLMRTIEEYSIFGIFGHVNGHRQYGFIHGDWALDNSRNGEFCGVNDEITILKETGCYADFTFPCYNEANPKLINSIYYATDNPKRPKSHNTGVPVCVGGYYARHPDSSTGRDLMIIGGPWHPFFRGGRLSGLRIYGDAIDNVQRESVRRSDSWVRTGIAVQGKENWIIIKTHTHGASDSEVALGSEIHALFSHLEASYRNHPKYALHYVTARELYNIIKAAENGELGEDPSAYRDYLVKPPCYDSSPKVTEASTALKEMITKSYLG